MFWVRTTSAPRHRVLIFLSLLDTISFLSPNDPVLEAS